MAKRWLKGRRVILHTDGARAYKAGINRKTVIEGIVHDYVVHKLKTTPQGRKQRGRYVQLFAHIINGETVHAKGGTQIIDRFWRSLRAHARSRSVALVGEAHLTNRVRSAQWEYWNRGEDLFAKTGEMLRSL